MPLGLTIVDAGDGTGGTATVSGSGGGDANDVYYAPFSGTPGSIAWTLAGSRVGDGDVALTIGAGYFVFQLVSAGTLGPVAYKKFTDATNDGAAHYRILNGIKARIDQLSKLNIGPNQVKVAWFPQAKTVDQNLMPLIWISPPTFEVDVSDVLGQIDLMYPTVVAIMVRQNQDSVANLPEVLKWREQIVRAVSYERVPGIAETMWAVPKPMNVVDPDSFLNRGILLSVMGFGIRTRLPRGLS